MTKPNLIILCGLPFSGKTTLAKKISEKLNYAIVAFDWIWAETYPDANPDLDKAKEWKLIRGIAKQRIVDLLKSGKSVVYDEVNPRFEHREEFRKLAEEVGADTKVFYIDVSPDEIRRRKEANLQSLSRHDVASVNFEKALADFELPKDSESVTVIRSALDIDNLLSHQASK